MPKVPKIFNRRNAALGYAMTKFGMPFARRALKRKIKSSAQDSGKAGFRAVKRNPGKSSIAIGSIVGAIGFYLTHRKGDSDDE